MPLKPGIWRNNRYHVKVVTDEAERLLTIPMLRSNCILSPLIGKKLTFHMTGVLKELL